MGIMKSDLLEELAMKQTQHESAFCLCFEFGEAR